jgi:replicative DNA helicase
MIDVAELPPPHSVETEAALLGNLLIYPNELLKIVDLLEPNTFYDERHRLIYAAINHLFESNVAVDPIALDTALLREGVYEKKFSGAALVYLTELLNHSGPQFRTESIAHTLLDYARSRENIRLAQDMATDAQNPTIHPNDLQTKYGALLAESGPQIDHALSMHGVMEDVLSSYEAAVQNPRPFTGLDTGFPALNQTLDGLCKSEMTILGARPSMGKSTFAQQIAYHVAHVEQVAVGFFTMEMSARQVGQRLLAIQAGIPTFKLRQGNLNASEQELLARYAAQFSQLPIEIKYGAGLTIPEARIVMRRLNQKRPVGLWIFDYLQLMKGDGRNENEAINSLTMGLKRLSQEFDTPMVVLSQLNRECESRPDKKPRIADLRASGGIEQDADNVLLLHRPGQHPELVRQVPEDERAEFMCIADVPVPKTRYGITGEVNLFWNGDTGRFVNEIPNHLTPYH